MQAHHQAVVSLALHTNYDRWPSNEPTLNFAEETFDVSSAVGLYSLYLRMLENQKKILFYKVNNVKILATRPF